MKNKIRTAVFACLALTCTAGYSQSDSLGQPGDNLDLRTVLNLFRQSSNLEDFEKKLNSADPKVNNLDLNNDGKVDYLRVVDNSKDNVHSIVIQDPVSKLESQDVAVIEIEKKGEQTAHIQIVGDETLYGKNYILEPSDNATAQNKATEQKEKPKDAPGKEDKYEDDVYASQNDKPIARPEQQDEDEDYNNNSYYTTPANAAVAVNVWAWPSVSYIYSPGYSMWVSPWYWGYYPGWYSPWAPYGYYSYYQGLYPYNNGFYWRRSHFYRCPPAHRMYYGRRSTSGYVQKTVRTSPGYNNARGRSDNSPRMRGSDNRNASPGTQNGSRNRISNSGSNSGNQGTRPNNRVRENNSRSDNSPANSGNRVNQGQRQQASPGGSRMNNGGGSRVNSGGGSGGSRMSGGGGGGSRPSGGGGGGGGGARKR